MKILGLRLLKIGILSIKDILPILLVVVFFQIVVLQNPVADLDNLLSGLLLVLVGLAMFVFGLEIGLFPIGETMATLLAEKGSVTWLIVFAFVLGFGTTFAEPALIAVAGEAANAAASGEIIGSTTEAKKTYANGLRGFVALAVGLAIVLGVLRIIKGWNFRNLIIVGYILVVIMTIFAPKWIIGIAYDAGGVTTSTITVPLVAALGVGLAKSIKGRNPMLDGFGIIAFASLTPMIFVMLYGMVIR